jgi:starch phosphorylase
LIIAGKAHPAEEEGKQAIHDWVELAQDDRLRDRLVFLEDYDISIAQELVGGVDVWINTPRRPWEACGTSGMKVLVNGGLNVSELDGWWDEAYSPAVGWAIGDASAPDQSAQDVTDAEQLYSLIENSVVPEFYHRDARGLPMRWLERVRASMGELTARFSANRMVREYVETVYTPAAGQFRARSIDGARLAHELARWSETISLAWSDVAFDALDVRAEGDGYRFSLSAKLGALDPCMVRVELYADPTDGDPGICIPMKPASSNEGVGEVLYTAFVSTTRPASHFTPRIVPFHPHAYVPAEVSSIYWAR